MNWAIETKNLSKHYRDVKAVEQLSLRVAEGEIYAFLGLNGAGNLLHRPKLLLLDEPANGLDPAGIIEVRELLLELTREEGVTVFISSHILAEVSRLAQRIGIIHQGHLLQELNIDEMERNRRRRLLVQTRDTQSAQRTLLAAGLPVEILSDGTIELKSTAAIERPDDINCLLVSAGTPPTRLLVEEEELEQYFIRLVGMDEGSHYA